MAKGTWGPLPEKDDPIFSTGPQVHFKPPLTPSTADTASSMDGAQHPMQQPNEPHPRSGKETLVYRTVGHNGGLVFASESRAKYVARLHQALRTSRTWAQFRAAVPPGEYSAIIRSFDDFGEPRPRSTDSFSAESVPGWSDGDYPPWLQKEMEDVVPMDILEAYGTLERTFVNGCYWHLPSGRASDIVKALEGRGFIVREASDLKFH